MSLRSDTKSPGTSLKVSSKAAGPTPTKRRNSTLWSETLDIHQKSTFSTKEIKRQEVVQFNLKYSHLKITESRALICWFLLCLIYFSRQFMSFTGESRISSKIFSLLERLEKITYREVKTFILHWSNYLLSRCFFVCLQAYHDPMLKLSIMTEEELAHIFGDLDAYIPLHEGKLLLTILTSIRIVTSSFLLAFWPCVLFIICRLIDETDRGNWPQWNSGSDWANSYKLGMYDRKLMHPEKQLRRCWGWRNWWFNPLRNNSSFNLNFVFANTDTCPLSANDLPSYCTWH